MTKITSKQIVLKRISGPQSCDMCGKPGLKTDLIRDPFIYGVGGGAVELTADVPVHTCSHCSVSFTGEEAEVARHDAVCKHLGVLTPKEIRELRRRHNMSRAAFARVTGFGEATLARWERREVIQNISSDRLLRLLQFPGNFRRLASMSDQTDIGGSDKSCVVGKPIRFVALNSRTEALCREQGTEWNLRRKAA